MKANHRIMCEKERPEAEVDRMMELEHTDMKMLRPCPESCESCQLNIICKRSVMSIQLGKIKNNLLDDHDLLVAAHDDRSCGAAT
jgi:hypothetical protein